MNTDIDNLHETFDPNYIDPVDSTNSARFWKAAKTIDHRGFATSSTLCKTNDQISWWNTIH